MRPRNKRRSTGEMKKLTLPPVDFYVSEQEIEQQLDYLVYECLEEAIAKDASLRKTIVDIIKEEVKKVTSGPAFEKYVREEARKKIRLAVRNNLP